MDTSRLDYLAIDTAYRVHGLEDGIVRDLILVLCGMALGAYGVAGNDFMPTAMAVFIAAYTVLRVYVRSVEEMNDD